MLALERMSPRQDGALEVTLSHKTTDGFEERFRTGCVAKRLDVQHRPQIERPAQRETLR
jgi:hypothetical protein